MTRLPPGSIELQSAREQAGAHDGQRVKPVGANPTTSASNRADTRVEDEARAFVTEAKVFESLAARILNEMVGRLAFELFAWAHASENPNRCSLDHGEDLSRLWGQRRAK